MVTLVLAIPQPSRLPIYAALYATLFHKFASIVEESRIGDKVDNFIKTLIEKFGIPDVNDIINELEPIAEKYDYIFRTKKIEQLLYKIINK